MTAIALGLQQALYDRLRAAVYDSSGAVVTMRAGTSVTERVALASDAVVEVQPSQTVTTDYPRVTIGEIFASTMDSKTSRGHRMVIRLHFWAQTGGFAALHSMMDTAYKLLHQQPLFVNRRPVINVEYLMSDVMRDPDGLTMHGVQEYAVLSEWAPSII